MKTEFPLVSVIIPTYRRSELLGAALESVRLQTYPNIEIIVVDDNNEESERCKVDRVLSSYKGKVTGIVNTRTKGGCGARNCGIDSSNGLYVAFLDDDDIWSPEKLTLQVNLLSSNAIYSGVSCHFISTDTALGFERIRNGGRAGMRLEHALSGECPPSSSLVMVKRDVLIKAGLFDETMQSFQDYDMWLRCLPFGQFGCVDKPLVKFVSHAGDRTSVNMSRRMAGLRDIERKWSAAMQPYGGYQQFQRNMMAGALFANGMANFGRHYSTAVSFFFRAMLKSKLKFAFVLWFGISLCGSQLGLLIYHFLMKFRNRNAI